MAQPPLLTLSGNHYNVCWGVCHTPQCPSVYTPATQGLVLVVGLWCERCWAEWALHHHHGLVPPEFALRRASITREALLEEIARRRGIPLDSFLYIFIFYLYEDPPPPGRRTMAHRSHGHMGRQGEGSLRGFPPSYIHIYIYNNKGNPQLPMVPPAPAPAPPLRSSSSSVSSTSTVQELF